MQSVVLLVMICIAFTLEVATLILKWLKLRMPSKICQLIACGFFIAYSSFYVPMIFKSDATMLDIANFIMFLFSIAIMLYELITFKNK